MVQILEKSIQNLYAESCLQIVKQLKLRGFISTAVKHKHSLKPTTTDINVPDSHSQIAGFLHFYWSIVHMYLSACIHLLMWPDGQYVKS